MHKFIVNGFILSFFTIFLMTYHHGALASSVDAQEFIEKVSNRALEVITSNANDAQKEEKLTNLFTHSVDTKWLARFVMGKYWNESTEVQRNKYVGIYKEFLLRNYIPKFKEYNNQQIKVIKAYANDDSEYMVETKIISNDGTEVNVAYKIRKDTDNKYMIYDVVAEGVSLITTQRSDFASVLSREGIEALIEKLATKGS